MTEEKIPKGYGKEVCKRHNLFPSDIERYALNSSLLGRWLSESGDVESLNMPTRMIEREARRAICIALQELEKAMEKEKLEAVAMAKKQFYCSTCGFPKDMKREMVFIKANVFEIMRVKTNTCKECGHQSDGSTISKLQPYRGKIIEIVSRRVRLETTKKIFEKIKTKLHHYCLEEGLWGWRITEEGLNEIKERCLKEVKE